MCSNTSLCSGDGSGGDNGGYSVNCIYSKKTTKRQKIPKRGPGVAELEKILKEQEKKNDFYKTKNEGFSLVSPLSNSFRLQPQQSHLPSSSLLPKNTLFAPDPTHFSTTTTTLKGSDTSNTPLGGGNGGKSGVFIGGSGVYLPEHSSLPTMWNSCQPRKDVLAPKLVNSGLSFFSCSPNGSKQLSNSPALHQRSQYSPPSIINLCPYSAVSSSTTPPSGLPHSIEPPSNETPHSQYTSLLQEEDKMIGSGTKRARPFSMEIPAVPPFRHPIPTFSSEMNRADSSYACGSNNVINVDPIVAVTREVKPASTSFEPNFKMHGKDYEQPNGSFLLFGSPTVPLSANTSKQERSTINTFPFQENKVDSQQRKPFYAFLAKREPKGFNLNDEAVETRDEIDLSLKL